jgi:hypothetical protein
MKLQRLCAAIAALTTIGTIMAGSRIEHTPEAHASDHDDGETDLKSRALNLTDHFAFKTPVGTPPAPTDRLALVMYVNPRSLPGRQYFLSPDARYEFHVAKVIGPKTSPAIPRNDFVFRFEASPPQANGTQFITLSVIRDTTVVATHIGASTSFAASKAGTVVTNNAVAEGNSLQYFVGMRTDSFFFDVNRFFQVRAYLAKRFFGGAAGNGDASAALAANCEGDAFLANIVTPGSDVDGDGVNLFNPPTCAPDFTKNLNVTAIVLSVPKALLGGGNVYDTWSTISVLQ